ncbi:MAG: NGG1p interacting factor NIF3 [Gammaproteobacteria bacterium]|nr:NGG1p interacting factor NIF3 [Gammaproteobacteria bacterium]
MVKVEFYVPESHLEQVKTAMFDAGAGRVGDYDCCAWQTLGQGQFRPLSGSKPFFGQQGSVETVAEYKVEMVCIRECVDAVIAAMKESHPYEEVAYCVIRMEEIAESI